MVRIVLDPREPSDFARLEDLSDNIRVKREGPLMHLKAYAVDGAILREGSANFSFSGETGQDNDLEVIRDASTAARFEAHFQSMWADAIDMADFAPAVDAPESRQQPAEMTGKTQPQTNWTRT